MSMLAACKLLHLLEAFSTPWFLFSNPTNHHLVFFLLEMFNNIIQYQFDGNSNLVYTVIRKRQVFHALANLPTDCGAINKTLTRRGKKTAASRTTSVQSPPQSPMESKELPNSQVEPIRDLNFTFRDILQLRSQEENDMQILPYSSNSFTNVNQ